MAGQIIKRGDNTWLVRIFTGCDTEGKRRYLNKTIKGKKKDAETYLSKTITAISTDTFVEPSRMSLNAYLDKWLDTAARPRLSERGFVAYGILLNLYVRPVLGDKIMSEVRAQDIQSLYAKMQERGLAASTIRHAHTPLSSAFKQAIKWRIVAQDPTALVELPRIRQKEMRAFSPIEAMHFLTSAAQDRWAVLFALALTTGMRPEEYFGLQWKDIDLASGVITVQRSLVWRSNKSGDWYFGELKTTRSRRSIPLPASLVRSLVEHKRHQAEQRLKVGPAYQNLDLVFASTTGTPLIRLDITRRHFKPILKRAGLSESFRLYDLRHSCATLLLAANEHPKVVSERLGHASVTLTLDTYSHVLPTMQQAASDKLENMLFSKVGTL
ncbi:MAG TPA: tyrosine-type recombinase/integrase [Pyrinomonadaceae bacterium]|jgi:integrase|nr:tyrosine-type recombinase/integrase [Pyrinomonadaceae bacterium]